LVEALDFHLVEVVALVEPLDLALDFRLVDFPSVLPLTISLVLPKKLSQ